MPHANGRYSKCLAEDRTSNEHASRCPFTWGPADVAPAQLLASHFHITSKNTLQSTSHQCEKSVVLTNTNSELVKCSFRFMQVPTLSTCKILPQNAHSIHRLNVAWNNFFRFIFCGFWRESVKVLQYYCSSLPVSYIIDQRRILFWKRMSCSDNLVLRSMSHFVSFRIKAVSSVSVIKYVVWDFFARSVL